MACGTLQVNISLYLPSEYNLAARRVPKPDWSCLNLRLAANSNNLAKLLFLFGVRPSDLGVFFRRWVRGDFPFDTFWSNTFRRVRPWVLCLSRVVVAALMTRPTGPVPRNPGREILSPGHLPRPLTIVSWAFYCYGILFVVVCFLQQIQPTCFELQLHAIIFCVAYQMSFVPLTFFQFF